MSDLKNTIRVYVLPGGQITPAPTTVDTLALCADIVMALEARSECARWLAGQALLARVSVLVVLS